MCLLFKLASDATEPWKPASLHVPQTLKDGTVEPDLNTGTYSVSKFSGAQSLFLPLSAV